MKKIITLLLLIACACGVKAQIITTVAGTGNTTYNGDNIRAIVANLSGPRGICYDRVGNLYLDDGDHCRIRKINTDGIISTIGGTGVYGFSGDGGPATNAEIGLVNSIVIDSAGNIYLSDESNNRVREIDVTGNINTIAGDSTYGYHGDAVQATSTSLWGPQGIALDNSGNLFIADYGNNRIRKVDASGMITTVCGTCTAGYNGDNIMATDAQLNRPYGLFFDKNNDLILSDAANYRIRKITEGTGLITTIAGTGTSSYDGDGGMATDADIKSPTTLLVDNEGNIFFGDIHSYVVRRISTTGIISTIAGTGQYGYNGDNIPATDAQLNTPVSLAIDARGDIYIADFQNERIRYITNVLSTTQYASVTYSLKLYPNPSDGTFNILVSSKTSKQVSVSIVDRLGRTIRQLPVQANELTTVQEHIPPGVYFLSVKEETKATETAKLFIR